jgi:hypothetical protein
LPSLRELGFVLGTTKELRAVICGRDLAVEEVSIAERAASLVQLAILVEFAWPSLTQGLEKDMAVFGQGQQLADDRV